VSPYRVVLARLIVITFFRNVLFRAAARVESAGRGPISERA